jgi:hypothetical protein
MDSPTRVNNSLLVKTFTTIGDGTNAPQLLFNGSAGNLKAISFNTAGLARWICRSNATAEAGTNTGSDFEILNRDDSGVGISTAIFIRRKNGNITLNGSADDGFKLDVQGNSRALSGLLIGKNAALGVNNALDIYGISDSTGSPVIVRNQTGTILSQQDFAGNWTLNGVKTASTGSGISHFMLPALTASANSDDLIGLRINPTYTDASFTGVKHVGLFVTGILRSTLSGSDMVLETGAKETALRAVRANGWVDTQSAMFFQIGASTDRQIFSASGGTTPSRTLFTSSQFQISSSTYTTTKAPVGVFEIASASTAFFNVFSTGNVSVNNTTDDTVNRLQVTGSVKADQYRLSALNTAPASATATGTLGEIRWDANFMYVCTATNTWKRSAIATW